MTVFMVWYIEVLSFKQNIMKFWFPEEKFWCHKNLLETVTSRNTSIMIWTFKYMINNVMALLPSFYKRISFVFWCNCLHDEVLKNIYQVLKRVFVMVFVILAMFLRGHTTHFPLKNIRSIFKVMTKNGFENAGSRLV